MRRVAQGMREKDGDLHKYGNARTETRFRLNMILRTMGRCREQYGRSVYPNTLIPPHTAQGFLYRENGSSATCQPVGSKVLGRKLG